MLGCSDYSAWIADRGGRRLLMQLPWTSLEWNRVVDDIGSAKVTLDGKGGRCCGEYADAKPWKHELVLFRNDELAWCGPVTHKSYDDDGITLDAQDVMGWTAHRRIHNDLVHTGVDLSTVFNAYVRDAMAVDNSPRLEVQATPCGVVGDRRVLAAQYQIAWNLIDELCSTGVDFTVIGRTVLVGGFEIEVEPIGTLLDSHIAARSGLEVAGEPMTTDSVVLGDGYGEAGATIVGHWPDQQDLDLIAEYGVHEVVLTEPDAKDAASARARARTNYDLNSSPKLILSGVELEQGAPFDLDQLIPGRVIRTLLVEQCEAIATSYRMTRVTGSAGPEHDRVSIDFAPVGTAGVFA